MEEEDANWLKLLSYVRLGAKMTAPSPAIGDAPRTDFQRDFDRIVFSTAFRRLHDKTQVFPLPENDLVHSRLTHSLEVSCVGRSLGTMVGSTLAGRHPSLSEAGLSARSFGDIVAAANVADVSGAAAASLAAASQLQEHLRAGVALGALAGARGHNRSLIAASQASFLLAAQRGGAGIPPLQPAPG